MSLEVKPGMFSLAEAKVSWKAPWAMAVFSVLVLLPLGFWDEESQWNIR